MVTCGDVLAWVLVSLLVVWVLSILPEPFAVIVLVGGGVPLTFLTLFCISVVEP